MKRTVALALLLSLVCWAVAQPAPQKVQWIVPGRYQIRDMTNEPITLAGPQGVYVLNKGVLARFDAATLQQKGVVELFGKLDDLPAELAEGQDQWSIITERGQRLLPAAMTLHGNDLIILSGDQFFRVDPVALEIKVNKSLAADAKRNIRNEDYLFTPAPRLDFVGDILYHLNVSIANNPITITAIDSKDGAVLATHSLPAQLSTTGWKYFQGGVTFDYPNGPQSPLQWTATPDGIFLLRYGALAKLDPHTLEPIKVTELFGAVTNIDDTATAETKTIASLDRAQRQLPPVMLTQGKELLIISGDTFFRVNAETLAISRQSTLTQVDDNALVQRMNLLISYGQPQVQMTKKGLYVTRGRECLLVNPVDGAVQPLSMPDALTSALPFLRPRRQPFKTVMPKDGETVQLNGVAWPETKDGATTWLFYAPQCGGTFVLTGPNVAKVSANPNAQGGNTMLPGTFHQKADGAPGDALGTVEVADNPNAFVVMNGFPVNGEVKKRKVGDTTIWTISGMFEGEEYVLVGEKLNELTKVADLDGRTAFIIGKFSKQYENVPSFGRGYLEIATYNLPPTQETTADKQDRAHAAVLATSAQTLFVVRNGAVASFAADSLKQQAVCDLLPPAPELPKDGQLTDDYVTALNGNRNLRLQAPFVATEGADLAVLIPGAGFFHLDGKTLAVKAHQEQLTYLFPIQPSQCLTDGNKLYVANAQFLLALSADDGKVLNKVVLPELMRHPIYPNRMPGVK